MSKIETTKGEQRIMRMICNLSLALEIKGNVAKGTSEHMIHLGFEEGDDQYEQN